MIRLTKEQLEQLNYAIRTLQETQHSITVNTCIDVGVGLAVVLAIYFLIKTAYDIIEERQDHCRTKIYEMLKRQEEVDNKLSAIKSAQRDYVDVISELRSKAKTLDERIKKLEPVPIEATKALMDITSQFTGKS